MGNSTQILMKKLIVWMHGSPRALTSNTFLKYGALRTSKEKDTSESDAELLSKRCMFMRPRNDFCRCNVCEQCFEHFLKNYFLLLGRYK